MPELVCAATNRDAWLTARRSGITATDIVTILGLSAYDSPYSLYWRKLGQVPETEDNDRMRLGRELQPYVRTRWEEASMTIETAYGGSLFRSADRPWQMATPDYLTYHSPDGATTGVLEVKTWADAARDMWADGPPASVRVQVLWQMDVMDVPTGHVGVLFLPSGEFRGYVIEHEVALHESFAKGLCRACVDLEMMRREGKAFYRRLQDNDPPDPDASAATLAAVKARFARQQGKRGTVELELWNPYVGTLLELEHWTANKRKLESRIREQLGEADEIEVNGQLVGRRIVTETTVRAKEYVRHQDYIRRIKTNGSDDE